MRALVLAGGTGTRLRPITHTSAKQLLPVANKPVLFYGLEAIAEAGITDVGMVVGDTAAAIEAAVGDGSKFGIRVTYIRQEAPLGLAHAVLAASDFLQDDDFVMYLGDNFIVGGITALVEEFSAARPDAQIMLTKVADARDFGVAELDDGGQVIGLEEKPRQPKSDLALVGVYMFTAAVHQAVRALKPSWRGELEITEAIQWLIDHGMVVRSTTITGYWKDTGNVTDMLEVNRLVLEAAEPRLDGTVEPGLRNHRQSRGRDGRAGVRVPHRRAGDHRRGDEGDGVVHRTVHRHRERLRDRRQRDRVLDPAPGSVHPGSPADPGIPDRQQRRGDPGAAGAAGPPARARRPQQGADQRMRLLVTGGAGFIGSQYVRSLLGGGYPGYEDASLTVLDCLSYAGNLANLEPVAGRFTFVHGNICDARLLADVLPGHDAVINFAAETHVDRSIAGAAEFVTANVTGVQVLLDACRAAGVAKIVHVSTDEVYGSIAAGAWAESAPIDPNSPYAAAKAGGDLIALAYARTHGLNVSITRCCNNYGPYQYPEKVIPLFATNLLDGNPVPLYGDGGNSRGWIHVDDHCRGIQLVLEKGEGGRVYHINGDAELTNRELTAAILEICGADLGHGCPGHRQEGARPALQPGRLAAAVDGVRAPGAVRRRPQGHHRVVRR